MKSKHLQTGIRISIFVIFVLILYKLVDPRLLKEALQNVRFEVIFVAILLYFINIAIRAYRWKKILNKNEKHLSLKNAYLLMFIGTALNLFIPAGIGDIAKSYYGHKMYGIKEEILAASIVDKMFALCSLFLLGSLSGYLLGHYILGSFSAMCAGLTFFPLTFPHRIPWNVANTLLRVVKKSLDIEKLVTIFRLPAKFNIFIFTISIGGWLFNSFYFYILCSAFPVNISLGYVILIMPVIVIARLFPFTVNALGPKEVVIVYFFGLIGINPTLAVLISLSSNIISSLLPGSIGFLILLTRGHGMRKKEGQNK